MRGIDVSVVGVEGYPLLAGVRLTSMPPHADSGKHSNFHSCNRGGDKCDKEKRQEATMWWIHIIIL